MTKTARSRKVMPTMFMAICKLAFCFNLDPAIAQTGPSYLKTPEQLKAQQAETEKREKAAAVERAKREAALKRATITDPPVAPLNPSYVKTPEQVRKQR